VEALATCMVQVDSKLHDTRKQGQTRDSFAMQME